MLFSLDQCQVLVRLFWRTLVEVESTWRDEKLEGEPSGGEMELKIRSQSGRYAHCRLSFTDSVLVCPPGRGVDESMPYHLTRGASIRQIAWLLFRTDPRVTGFAARQSERPEGREAVLKKMWERDEQGWRTELLDRARAMADVDLGREEVPE